MKRAAFSLILASALLSCYTAHKPSAATRAKQRDALRWVKRDSSS